MTRQLSLEAMTSGINLEYAAWGTRPPSAPRLQSLKNDFSSGRSSGTALLSQARERGQAHFVVAVVRQDQSCQARASSGNCIRSLTSAIRW